MPRGCGRPAGAASSARSGRRVTASADPLAVGLTTLGLAGLLVATVPSIVPGLRPRRPAAVRRPRTRRVRSRRARRRSVAGACRRVAHRALRRPSGPAPPPSPALATGLPAFAAAVGRLRRGRLAASATAVPGGALGGAAAPSPLRQARTRRRRAPPRRRAASRTMSRPYGDRRYDRSSRRGRRRFGAAHRCPVSCCWPVSGCSCCAGPRAASSAERRRRPPAGVRRRAARRRSAATLGSCPPNA